MGLLAAAKATVTNQIILIMMMMMMPLTATGEEWQPVNPEGADGVPDIVKTDMAAIIIKYWH